MVLILKMAEKYQQDGYLSAVGTDEVALSALIGAAEQTCVIQFPKGTNASKGPSWSFDGIVTSLSTGADLEDVITFSITLKVSGKPTFTVGS